MSTARPRALIADDEPLLRSALARQLAQAWPELEIVAQARHGREAIELFEKLQPEVCFLDVHMPGLSGVDAARQIGRRAQLVFVTAFSEYAIEAFEQGAVDYLVKPVEQARLADTVGRLQERLRSRTPAADLDGLLAMLSARLRPTAATAPLRWLHASIGNTLRLIPVEAIDYLRAEDKYTRIAWRDDGQLAADALIRTPLKDLLAQLDAAEFAQVHRSVVVNLRAISHVVRDAADSASVHLKGRDEVLPVSRSHLQRFRQM